MFPQRKESMNKPVIFFDWDGTLADSMALCLGEVSLTLERMGLPPVGEDVLRACNGPTYVETIPMLGIPAGREEEYLCTRQKCQAELIPQVLKLFPGVPEMLCALRPIAQMVVVSNGLQAYLDYSAQFTELGHFFSQLQGCIPGKTKSQVLGEMLAELMPSRCVMVGDRLGDILAGKANAVPTVAACYGFGNEQEYARADYRVNAPMELVPLLFNLLG